MNECGENTPNDNRQHGVGRRGLRVGDAAHYCGCSVHAIRNAISVGKLRAKMIGRALIILKDDADAYLDSLPYVESVAAVPVVVQSVVAGRAEEPQAA
jgi:excisionase family DNA binding protein